MTAAIQRLLTRVARSGGHIADAHAILYGQRPGRWGGGDARHLRPKFSDATRMNRGRMVLSGCACCIASACQRF